MEQRTYHGKITPQELATALLARFNTEDMTATQAGEGDRLVVNIMASGAVGGPCSLSVGLSPAPTGVTVTIGPYNILGVAADLLETGLKALVNPITLIGEITDVAQNVQRLTLPQQVWQTIDHYCQSVGASLVPEPSGVTCPYCGIISPLGTGQCPSCGAPLGEYQPIACPKCGRLLPRTTRFCIRCGTALAATGESGPISQGRPAAQPPRPIVARFDTDR